VDQCESRYLLSSLGHAQCSRDGDMRQVTLTPRRFFDEMGDGLDAIDRRSTTDGEEEIDLVIQGELFSHLDVFDSCEVR
jgi:hypothetical protein